MKDKIKEGNQYLCMSHYPSDRLRTRVKLVTVLGKNKRSSRKDAWYIRKPSGGSDTYTEGFLIDIPEELATLKAENERLKEGLTYIAKQKVPKELSPTEYEEADFLGDLYLLIVGARDVLKEIKVVEE